MEEYYVSNAFVEKVFDQINEKQDLIHESLLEELEKLKEMIGTVIDIRDKELPNYDIRINYCH